MGVSASQPAKLHSMVLTHRNLNIYNLNRFIIKQLYTIHKIISHHHHTNYNISHNDYWHKVRSMLHATISTSETEEGIIQPAMDILLHCIDTHYDRLIETRFQLIEQQITNTYHIINNNRVDSEDATTTTTRDIQASISYLLHQLREQAPITYKNTPESAYTSQDDTENVDTSLTTINASSSITENSNTTPVDIGEQNNNNGHTTVPASNNRSTLTNDNNNNNNNSNTQKQNRKSQKDRTKLKKNHTPEHCTLRNCYECATNNIVNLSNIQLTKTQVLLLNRGLSFVPTADNAKPMELIKEFDIFANKAKRKLRQMVDPPRPPRPNDEPALFRKPTNPRDTNSTPQTLGPRILEDTFQAIKLEISQLEQNPTTTHNLTRKERLTLKELASNHDLIINKADKGSTIVVRHRLDYIEEGLQHLSDVNTYLELDRDYTMDVNKIVKSTLQKLKVQGLLSPHMAEYCLPPPTPRTALIYFLKKIHKSPMGIRPIVSTVNSPTANMAEFLDRYLQPIMKGLPAYLKDTTQFLRELADIHIEQDTWLVTVDVKSLYTKIPNEEGIQACYEAWRKQESTDPQHPPAEVLRQLLEMVLKLNTFEFNDKHYLQKFGTAMGSKLAPAYANTFMGKLEQNILDSSPLKPIYYCRFIDDIFMLWPHTLDQLIQFMTHMNEANGSIQFTHEYNQEEIVFLDVVVYKDKNHPTDTLHTRTHIKPTNKQLYVREDSYHPREPAKASPLVTPLDIYEQTQKRNNSLK